MIAIIVGVAAMACRTALGLGECEPTETIEKALVELRTRGPLTIRIEDLTAIWPGDPNSADLPEQAAANCAKQRATIGYCRRPSGEECECGARFMFSTNLSSKGECRSALRRFAVTQVETTWPDARRTADRLVRAAAPREVHDAALRKVGGTAPRALWTDNYVWEIGPDVPGRPRPQEHAEIELENRGDRFVVRLTVEIIRFEGEEATR